jgi:hypothetical protein
MEYASNCPVSRPVILPIEEHASLGGMSWNNKWGLFFPVEDEMMPIRRPPQSALENMGPR